MALQKRIMKIGVAVISLFFIYCTLRSGLSAAFAYGNSFSAADTVALSVRTGNIFREITLWAAEDGRGYFFLPAYADLRQCCFLYEGDLSLRIDGEPIPSGQYLGDIQPEEPYTLSVWADGVERSSMDVVFLQSENLPAIYIDTESGALDYINADKSNKESADMEIVDASGRVIYRDELDYLKGHGNSTWTLEKIPLQIKLKEAEPLLDMGSSNKWILLANAMDDTLLRNWTAYHLAEAAGIEYTSETRFADLYINHEYFGNYQLAEKIDIGEERVDIQNLEKANRECNAEDYRDNPRFGAGNDKVKGIDGMNDPEDITGGYLLERNYGARYENRVSGFTTDGGESFVVRSPSYASKEEIAYIYNFIQSAENSILAEDGLDPATGLRYADLIDVESFVKKYLLEEIVLNEGQGATSSWFYKPENSKSDKLYAGPPWDYDKSLANHSAYKNPRALTKLSCYQSASRGTRWFEALCRKEEFWSMAGERYRELFLPALEELLDGGIDSCADLIRQSAYMDNIRWQEETDGQRDYRKGYEEAVDTMQSWLAERVAFLNEVWLEEKEFCIIRYQKEDGHLIDLASVRTGGALPAPPQKESDEGKLPLYWYDRENGLVYKPGQQVTHDLDLVVVY